MLDMSVTFETSQLAMFWLKVVAPLNMPLIDVTCATFQLPMLEIKVVLPLKALSMTVTSDTSQTLISPYFAVAATSFKNQASSAVLNSALVVIFS